MELERMGGYDSGWWSGIWDEDQRGRKEVRSPPELLRTGWYMHGIDIKWCIIEKQERKTHKR